ncbi:MAG: hypothetical protein WB561_18530 [Terracidiphilus sp.]
MTSAMYGILSSAVIGIRPEGTTQLQSSQYFIFGDLKFFHDAKTIAGQVRDFNRNQPINPVWPVGRTRSCSGNGKGRRSAL